MFKQLKRLLFLKPSFAEDAYLHVRHKIENSLVKHAYDQANLGQIASLFCATILILGLYDPQQPINNMVVGWYIFFLAVAAFRIFIVLFYQRANPSENNVNFWRNLFVIGAFLGGLSWGLTGGILFSFADDLQQTLIILVLAGVTAGASPFLAGIFSASFFFLTPALLPLISQLFFIQHNPIYQFFNLAVVVYFIFLIALAIKTHRMISHSISLQFENDALLKTLSLAKHQLELTNKKLEQAATHDPLTELANRSLFRSSLTEALYKAGRNQKLVGLLYLDLDNFKEINDQYGHHVGDDVLLILVQRLKESLRETDIVSRLGGDEITVIVENISEPEVIASLAKQICEVVAKPFVLKDLTIKTSASIGVSIYPTDSTEEESLLKMADKAMYFVKDHGGNNFHFYNDKIITKTV